MGGELQPCPLPSALQCFQPGAASLGHVLATLAHPLPPVHPHLPDPPFCAQDPEGFIEDGGWSFLDVEQSDSEEEGEEESDFAPRWAAGRAGRGVAERGMSGWVGGVFVIGD